MNDQEQKGKSIPKSYWVQAGRFRAGEYPGSIDEDEAKLKLGWLMDDGINFFVDLTQPGEYGLKPYAVFLTEEGRYHRSESIHCQMPVEDFSVPGQDRMIEILDTIDKTLEEGRNIYLHCLGGKGRTGTVVGCYLVRHGMTGEEALERIQKLRGDIPGVGGRSPETDEQRRMVLEWTKGR